MVPRAARIAHLAAALAGLLAAAAAALLIAAPAKAHSRTAPKRHSYVHRACAHHASYRSRAHGRRTRRAHCPARHRTRRRRHSATHPKHHVAHKRSSKADLACPGAGVTPTPENVQLMREAVLCLINRERAAHGESALSANAQLQQAAQAHSESMSAREYFDHNSPAGDTPVSRMRAAGYLPGGAAAWEVGENIAWGSLWLGSPRSIVEGWMTSPGHRANILDARFRDTAIGISARLPRSFAHGQSGAIYTQDFAVRMYR